MMATSKLQYIADSMRSALAGKPYGYVPKTLPGGLMLVLWRNGPQWRLTLRRVGVWPSEREAEICGRVFGVPEGTEPGRRMWSERASASQVLIWYCIDLCWREVEELPAGGAATV